jgi:hypothetical protein
VSEETKQKLTSSMLSSAQRVAGLQVKYISVSMRDPAFKAKLDRLVSDYDALWPRAG